MKKLLIVEDDNAISDLLTHYVESKGYEILTCENGEQALEVLDAQNIAVVVTDIIMPKVNGLNLIRQMKENNSQAKILAISGGGRNDPGFYLESAKEVGADAILEKPFDRGKFIHALEKCT